MGQKDRLRQLAASICRHASFGEIAKLVTGWQFIDSWVYGPFYLISALWDHENDGAHIK